MLKLEIIPGLRPEDRWLDWVYKMRDKWSDLDATREYHEQHPPQVGDLVVVLHTASHYEMQKPHVTRIKAMTDRGRIVVDHDHEAWAGKSFWKSGQNCKAPKGQCWLVPAELYRDIPLSRERAREQRSEQFKVQSDAERLSLTQMSQMLGGAREYVNQINLLVSEFGLTIEQADDELNRELSSEIELVGKRTQLGKRITREMIRNHCRQSLAQDKALRSKGLESENQMIKRGQMRSEGRRRAWQ